MEDNLLLLGSSQFNKRQGTPKAINCSRWLSLHSIHYSRAPLIKTTGYFYGPCTPSPSCSPPGSPPLLPTSLAFNPMFNVPVKTSEEHDPFRTGDNFSQYHHSFIYHRHPRRPPIVPQDRVPLSSVKIVSNFSSYFAMLF